MKKLSKNLDFPGDHSDFGGIHILLNVVFGLLILVSTVLTLVNWFDDDVVLLYYNIYHGIPGNKRDVEYHLIRNPIDTENKDDEKTTNVKPTNFKKYILYFIGIVILLYSFGGLKTTFKDCKTIYNTSKLYHNSYTQKVQEKEGFYDKLWKTYLQKEKITNVNKETFIQVTKVIMENRKDGSQLTWKWIQENQQIPYEEFTKFYSDLSNFITSQREGYFNIEKECQIIANKNNTLLDTFPNNMYNKFLKCERIKFEYGFTSDSTQTVFKTKKENVK